MSEATVRDNVKRALDVLVWARKSESNRLALMRGGRDADQEIYSGILDLAAPSPLNTDMRSEDDLAETLAFVETLGLGIPRIHR